jgi:hypothetical protein
MMFLLIHKESKMRKYELMTIYPLEEDKYKAGLENVKKRSFPIWSRNPK